MPGIVGLVTFLSLDVCASLVAQGVVSRQLAIVGASSTTPIVVETAEPHGVTDTLYGAHVVVSGVLGNLAANGPIGQDTVTHDAWVAAVVDPTHLALFSVDPTSGTAATSPVASSGAYTSGGTLSIALSDGLILLGRRYVDETGVPPRIVFVPVMSSAEDEDLSGRSNVAGYPSAEAQAQAIGRSSLSTDRVHFEVHAWGGTGSDPRADFDIAQRVQQQVVRTSIVLAQGVAKWVGGTWTDQQGDGTADDSLGHEIVFGVSFATPIQKYAVDFVPDGTVPYLVVSIQPADPNVAPEIAFEG